MLGIDNQETSFSSNVQSIQPNSQFDEYSYVNRSARSKSTIRTKTKSDLPAIMIIPESNNTFRRAAILTQRNESISPKRLSIIDNQSKSNQGDNKKHADRRILYQGEHQIPVFNLKFSEQPQIHRLKFIIYRTLNKIYFEAKPLRELIMSRYVNTNVQLIVSLSEKLAAKYLMSSDNDFTRLIEDRFIIANNRLQIEKFVEYTVDQVMSNGTFAVVNASID